MKTLLTSDILKTLVILAIVIFLSYYIYKYLGHSRYSPITTETFTSPTVFDLVPGTYQTSTIWSNYLKNATTQTQAAISIWVPVITNTNTQRMLGFGSLVGAYENIPTIPSLVSINMPDYVKEPIRFNKVFETGMINTPFYTATQYNYLVSGTNPNSRTDIPLQYTTVMNGNQIYVNYVYDPSNPSSPPIMELDRSNSSITQLQNEINKVQSAYAAYQKNNLVLINQFIKRNYANGIRITNTSVINLNGNTKINFNNPSIIPSNLTTISIPLILNNPAFPDSRIIKKLDDNQNSIINTRSGITNHLNAIPNNSKINYISSSINITIPLGLQLNLYDSWNYSTNTFGNMIYSFGLPIGTTQMDFDNYWQNLGLDSNLVKFDGSNLIITLISMPPINAIQIKIMAGTYAYFQDRDPALTQSTTIQTYLNSLQSQLNTMIALQTAVSNGTVDYPAFSCWAPVPPENYMAVGHLIFNNIGLQPADISMQYNNQIACIPTHCYRKAREWVASDIIFKYDKSGAYFAIYLNPFTNTFIGTTNRAGPDGLYAYPGKIIPCPKKDYTIENIIGFDKNIRNNCKSFKSIEEKTPLVSSDAASTEDTYLQNKLYSQTQKIEALKAYANTIAMDNMKGQTINQEYNRAQLQNYIDNQRDEIDKAIRLLEDGRNRVEINVNYKRDAINQIVNIIANSKTIPPATQVQLIQKLQTITGTDMKAQVISALATCPQFDLSGYIKKDPPCFGCSIPSS